MASAKSQYILRRDDIGHVRQNLLHALWTDEDDGHLLHASVPVGSNCKIADVATGTGIWAMQVARKFPDAHVDGFDVDLSAVPPKDWRSSNVNFECVDAFGEVPPHLIGKYEFV